VLTPTELALVDQMAALTRSKRTDVIKKVRRQNHPARSLPASARSHPEPQDSGNSTGITGEMARHGARRSRRSVAQAVFGNDRLRWGRADQDLSPRWPTREGPACVV